MVKDNAATSVAGDHDASAGVVLTLAATVSDEVNVWVNDTGRTVEIVEAGFAPISAVTGAATNNMALQFKNKGVLGTGTTGITTVKTYASTVNIAAHVKDVLTLATAVADRQVPDGAVVTLDKTENGTGLALPQGIATLKYKFV